MSSLHFGVQSEPLRCVVLRQSSILMHPINCLILFKYLTILGALCVTLLLKFHYASIIQFYKFSETFEFVIYELSASFTRAEF